MCFSQNKLDLGAIIQLDQLSRGETEGFLGLKSDSEMKLWPLLMTDLD